MKLRYLIDSNIKVPRHDTWEVVKLSHDQNVLLELFKKYSTITLVFSNNLNSRGNGFSTLIEQREHVAILLHFLSFNIALPYNKPSLDCTFYVNDIFCFEIMETAAWGWQQYSMPIVAGSHF